jgi:hypothetical protein
MSDLQLPPRELREELVGLVDADLTPAADVDHGAGEIRALRGESVARRTSSTKVKSRLCVLSL